MEVLMNKSLKTILSVVVLMFLLSACNLGVKATPDAAATLNPLYTAAAQTLEAMATQAVTTPGGALATSTPLSVGDPTATTTATSRFYCNVYPVFFACTC